ASARQRDSEIVSHKIIGVGNQFRRDDSVGIEAARRLAGCGLGGVEIWMLSGEGAELMERWAGAAKVIVVDASRSGAPPGTIHRLDPSSEPILSRFFHYSSHAFGVAEAIELARALGRLPPEMIIFGIEGQDFSAGEGLTPVVASALETVTDLIMAEIQ
ncbi:hydrogenase maturation protease, partial [Bacteroidota bacterium]